MSKGSAFDSEDYFAPTRMSFGDHIEELRAHLLRAVKWFLLALAGSLFIGHFVLDWITAPVKDQLDRFYDRRQQKVLTEKRPEILAKADKATPFRKIYFHRPQLKAIIQGKDEADPPRPVLRSRQELEARDAPPPNWLERLIGKTEKTDDPSLSDYKGKTIDILDDEKDEHLVAAWVSIEHPLWLAGDTMGAVRTLLEIDKPTTLNVQEAFMVWFKVCMVCGLVIGSPMIFLEVWMFVAAGLYPHEKKLVHVYLPASLTLFLIGVLMCYFFVIPRAIEALLYFNEWLGFKPDLRLNEWLGFAIMMPVVFGISFQTPLVMLFVGRLGIMTPDSFRGKRSYAWFGMAIFAAVCTPSTDAFSMLFLWVPMGLLFELGIFLMKFSPPAEPEQDDEFRPDELVEV